MTEIGWWRPWFRPDYAGTQGVEEAVRILDALGKPDADELIDLAMEYVATWNAPAQPSDALARFYAAVVSLGFTLDSAAGPFLWIINPAEGIFPAPQ